MSRKIVHVVGTGTIGEPLIGLLCDFKKELGIDEVTFHKNTPLTTDKSKVMSLINKRKRQFPDAILISAMQHLRISELKNRFSIG